MASQRSQPSGTGRYATMQSKKKPNQAYPNTHNQVAKPDIPVETNQTTSTSKKKKTKKNKPANRPAAPLPPPPLPAEVSDEEISAFMDIHVPGSAYAPILQADLRVGYVNINALYGVTKMPYVHWLMKKARLDIAVLIDVRSTDASVPFLLAKNIAS